MISELLNTGSGLPRIAMVSTHGYVAAAPPLGADDTGGQVVYVLELSRKFAELGYEVDIWTRRFLDQPEIEAVSDRVRVLRAPCGGREFIAKEYLARRIPEWCENVLRVIEANGLKYAFVASHYWDAGVGGQRLTDALDIPHIHTPHSLGLWKRRQMLADFPGDAQDLERRYNFEERIRRERALYSEADLVVATTPQQLDLILAEYGAPPQNCRMVPPGYDDARFFPMGEASRTAIRQRLGFSGNVVMAIGRVARNKGYDLLIDGFNALLKRVPDAVLHLAIGGASVTAKEQALLDELHQQVERLGLGDKVIFGGFVADEDLADFYRAADVFVLSSRYEPFGMTAIEAMASGTPTVVTIHGGLYRVLTFGRHALFADPLDAEDLGVTIAKVLRHPRLRERLARMGAHKARSLFTWTGVAQQLIATMERRPAAMLTLSDTEWDEPWNDND